MRWKKIKDYNGTETMKLIEYCRQKEGVPVAIMVMGFDTPKSDGLICNIASAEGMAVVDYAALRKRYVGMSDAEVDNEWRRLINEAMMSRKGAIIKRHFGDNVLTRHAMIQAARRGMKYAKTILLRLTNDPVKGFLYHQEKYNIVYNNTAQQIITENILYGKVELNEDVNYIVDIDI